MGKVLGVSKAAVSKYENSMSYPPYDILITMSETFKVSTDYLLGVGKNKTVNVDGLTNKQVDSIIAIISECRKLNE